MLVAIGWNDASWDTAATRACCEQRACSARDVASSGSGRRTQACTGRMTERYSEGHRPWVGECVCLRQSRAWHPSFDNTRSTYESHKWTLSSEGVFRGRSATTNVDFNIGDLPLSYYHPRHPRLCVLPFSIGLGGTTVKLERPEHSRDDHDDAHLILQSP